MSAASATAERAASAAIVDADPEGRAIDLRSQGLAWVALVERLSKNLERGGRQWTAARRKSSLQRVLSGSRSDPALLLQRLQSLMGAWEGDHVTDDAPELADSDAGAAAPTASANALPVAAPNPIAPSPALAAAVASPPVWPIAPVLSALQRTVVAGLPAGQPDAAALAAQLADCAAAVAAAGATPANVAAIEVVCEQALRLFGHRHHLIDELAALCRELGAGMSELAEDDSWAQGQCKALQARLADEMGVRSVRGASALLAETRVQQQRVRSDRHAARDALRQVLHGMLQQVGELGATTGRFQLATEAHAQAIEQADSLAGLAGVVQAMLSETRSVQAAVGLSQQRLQADHDRAEALESKVRALEGELRRLSDEVSTDPLTQVANRRGLDQAFAAESARCLRAAEAIGPQGQAAAVLAVALIDIDNFKKLNDSLGHAAGDRALQTLSAAVKARLRPVDHLARFGGEEFVVLLPGTVLAEAQQALTRLQRGLTEALFLHEGREVFVTFSAGVTAWRAGEALQLALERADQALYEAKRTGKNRTCMA